jgi:ADP-ribosyl-[dinitrogen reductase] hydrolase
VASRSQHTTDLNRIGTGSHRVAHWLCPAGHTWEPHHARWQIVLTPHWHPLPATESNGAEWPTLGTALWALRTTTFEDALRTVADLGGDTDTVAAVTGSLAGAVHGLTGIPTRWTERVHTPLPGFGPTIQHAASLIDLARKLGTP